MNTYRLIIPLVILAIVFSCKPDKQSELDQLKKQQAELTEKIKKLESELGDSAKKTDLSKILLVSVDEIKPTLFKHYIEVQGRIDGEENIDVQPEGLGGIVQSILVKTGQNVTKGQTLARINDAALRDQLKALESTYQLAKENFERQQRLWDQKIGSEMQYLTAKSNKEGLESQLSALKEQINMNIIKSPINGTVEEINLKIGQLTSPQMPTPAFRVVNFNSVKVKAEVAEAYSNRVSVGDNVIVLFPDIDNEIPAKISAVSRYINQINRTFLVEVKIDAGKSNYKANMIAVLKINDYKSENAVVIPVNYIQTDMDGDFVYVAAKNSEKIRVKRVPVKQGQSYSGMVEITEGIVAGTKVITSGYLDIEEGEEVRF
jgi:RND family efflux transporter MFP subunit